jgi:hypothetical protein
MARTIRVGDIGDYANSQMEKLLRSAVLETDALLKSASPVDTGRFRASWQVGVNATRHRWITWALSRQATMELHHRWYTHWIRPRENWQRLQQSTTTCRMRSHWLMAAASRLMLAGCKVSLKTCKVECA